MSIDLARFAHPPASLRGAPFWSLNNDLTDHDRLREQIDAFAEMGIGGYHMHVRSGLKTRYMSDDFLAAIRAIREHGASKGMLSYLYDEDTWPSGFAGGEVTRDPAYRQRYLRIQRGRPEESTWDHLLFAYRLDFDDQGRLLASTRIDLAAAGDDDWYLLHRVEPDNDRFNGQAYIDVMNPTAVDAFIASTHERFLATFDGAFPADVPAIFTDEPQLHGSHPPVRPGGDAHLPWTDDLPTTFGALYDVELFDVLPQVIWSGIDGPSVWRWRFWDHIAERYAEAFADRIGDWCERHGIALTGHLMAEESLRSQINSLGEAMRHYRGYQIPGIDILCDRYEPSTAKQAVSVARQDGREGVLSELYGVTNWDFPFRGHKCQGDWQAALGITLRVHHLAWLSMEGDSKRDYPAAIGPQSPWYREYRLVEDHFARVGAALTEGCPLVRVGVIHPVESAWLYRGLQSLEGVFFDAHEQAFHDLINGLLDGQIDFDFIAESLLPRQERATAEPRLQVGAMAYDVVVVPELATIRSSTLERLGAFLQRGGRVIVLGELPARCDGAPSERPARELAAACRVPRTTAALLAALDDEREIEVLGAGGGRMARINHQLRVVGDERILFCAHRQQTETVGAPWARGSKTGAIRIRGNWQVSELETSEGVEQACAYSNDGAWTVVPWTIEAHSHRLLRLRPGRGEQTVETVAWQVLGDCVEPYAVRRQEPNLLLLDRAEWQVDGEGWQPAQECIATALQLGRRFAWPDWGQPYSVEPGAVHGVERRFRFVSEVDLQDLRLVCERLAEATVVLDGQALTTRVDGWWIDRDLTTMDLPPIGAGEHELCIGLPCDAVRKNLEWCYLLGDFGVRTAGAHARIVADSDQVCWGDAVAQGLPFYGGNLDYHLRITVAEAGRYAITAPCFAGSLLRISCDGRDCGPLAYAPFRAPLGELAAGEHELVITAFGNRMNTFGALHNCAAGWHWWGPPSWRSQGAQWNDVWQFRPIGITRAPILERAE